MPKTDLRKAALIVVDFQEDFCPPNGSLACPGGRDLVDPINKLLSMPFALKLGTQDWHPADHISFASNHSAPNNKPFDSMISVVNPNNPSESMETRLWPDHCIQDSPGAALIPEMHSSKLDHVIRKGQRRDIEMYSAFRDSYKIERVVDSGVLKVLRDGEIESVYVVGLALDHCVKWTALHAVEEGFKTFVVEEGTNKSRWNTKEDLEAEGVVFIRLASLSVDTEIE